MDKKKRLINLLPVLLILPVFLIAIFNFNFNKDFQNVVNKIYLLTGNEEEEQEKYTIQEVKMLAVSLKVKESYNEDIMVKPLTCSVNINRMVKLIYMDGDKELGSKYIYYRKPVGNLMQPSKKGFDFVEWTNVEGEVVDKDTVLASEVDYYVYANWNKHVSTLTVNPASGVWNSSTETKNFNLAYEETKEITDPTRDGYNFTGWDLKGEASTLENKIFTMGYENSTLTAQWTPKEYNLNFNANQGGNLSMNSKKVTYTMPYGELATTSRTSYTFGGWYTAAQGGTQVNEQTIHSVTHDTTVYAHWNNTAPATPQITTYYKNANKSDEGMLQRTSGSTETITITVNSKDKEDATPDITLSCVSGNLCNYLKIERNSNSNGEAHFTATASKMGVAVLKATSKDLPGLSSSDSIVVYVYGPDGAISQDAGYTDTTFDSGWLDQLEGCYISEYVFSVKFASGHSNGDTSDPDKMVVKGKTKSGKEVQLYEWHGNMESTLHEQKIIDMSQYNSDPIVSIQFYTYSPHISCARNATIHYSVKYKFNKDWIK